MLLQNTAEPNSVRETNSLDFFRFFVSLNKGNEIDQKNVKINKQHSIQIQIRISIQIESNRMDWILIA